MQLIAILLGAAAVCFALLWLQSRRNLRDAAQNLARIRREKSAQRLRLRTPDRALEALIFEANCLLNDQQQAEQHHRRAEQLRRDEIANISHDLRTPLTSISGYLQLMEQPSCTEQERQEYLAICKSRARTLEELIAQFYDLFRTESEGSLPELVPVEPAGMLYELVTDFYQDFLAANLEPKLEIPEILPEITADRQALSRIFQNLIQNALRHGNGILLIQSKTEADTLCLSFR